LAKEKLHKNPRFVLHFKQIEKGAWTLLFRFSSQRSR